MSRSRSVRIVVDALHGDLRPEALLAHVHAAGVEPHEAMDIIAEHTSVHDDYDDVEKTRWVWLAALVAVYGLEEASRITARTVLWADIDLIAHYATARAHSAIIDEVPVSRAYALVTVPEIPEGERRWLFARMAYVYPLEELAYLDDLPAAHAAELAWALTKRITAIRAFDELTDQVEDERVLAALRQYWQVDVRADSPAPIIELAARLCVDACRPLAALLENGVGRSASLDLLRAHGWSCERLVASLARRGALLPEVRDQLVELGVPVSAQRALLLEHWEPASIELVLGSERPALRLASGD